MSLISILCSYCHRKFVRYSGHVHESINFGYKLYCSDTCQGSSKKRRLQVLCENPHCTKYFERTKSELSPHNYCSSSCAAQVSNAQRQNKIRLCANTLCKKEFQLTRKYCSNACQPKTPIIEAETVIDQIKAFYQTRGRIPLKREFSHPRAARERFGSWNKAIVAAGFTPNPVMFAMKYFAKDGHKCDSLAEKIIDDWLNRKKIDHKRSIPYPGNPTLTVDFVVAEYWIEFFGLFGEHRRYDELRKEKLALANHFQLKLIELYPHHLFPKNTLAEILKIVV